MGSVGADTQNKSKSKERGREGPSDKGEVNAYKKSDGHMDRQIVRCDDPKHIKSQFTSGGEDPLNTNSASNGYMSARMRKKHLK